MSKKIKPCIRCGSTERYERKGGVLGPCKECAKKVDTLKYYYLKREENMVDISWRLKKLCQMAKSRAGKKGREFNITPEFLLDLWEEQDGKCSISGIPFELNYSEDGGPHRNGPSLDRIDSSLGYTTNNVRIVTYHVNTALSNFGEEALMELAEQIVKQNRNVN